MKAIEIKAEMKYPFLEAARLAGLQVEELKKICYPKDRCYFRVTTEYHSQDDLFRLGVYFAQLTLSV
jgi:hypothetical protein